MRSGHRELIIMSKMVKSHARLGVKVPTHFDVHPAKMDTWVGLKSNLYGRRTAVICPQWTGTRYHLPVVPQGPVE
jgi:hypothetical protein